MGTSGRRATPAGWRRGGYGLFERSWRHPAALARGPAPLVGARRPTAERGRRYKFSLQPGGLKTGGQETEATGTSGPIDADEKGLKGPNRRPLQMSDAGVRSANMTKSCKSLPGSNDEPRFINAASAICNSAETACRNRAARWPKSLGMRLGGGDE